MAVSHTFTCDRCGAEAGRLALYAPGETVPARGDGEIGQLVTQFDNAHAERVRFSLVSGIGDITFTEFDIGRTLAALAAGDADALYATDPEFVPFWCPRCHSSYCGRHWETWDLFDDGFFDEKRGRCPKAHERKLMD